MQHWVYGHLSLPNLSPAQRAYFEWLRDSYKETEVHSYLEHPKISKLGKRRLKAVKIKQCFQNAFTLALETPGVSYVVGFAQSFIPVPHAWNACGDFHFDLTAELAVKRHSPDNPCFSKYASIYRLEREDLAEAMSRCRVMGPELADYWEHFIYRGSHGQTGIEVIR